MYLLCRAEGKGKNPQCYFLEMYNEPLVQPCPVALDVPYLDFSVGKDLSWHAVQAFSCYQGTKVAHLVLAKPRAELRSAYQFHLVSHAGYYLPFMGSHARARHCERNKAPKRALLIEGAFFSGTKTTHKPCPLAKKNNKTICVQIGRSSAMLWQFEGHFSC